MRRYLQIYRTFIASSLSRELEFRANFFAKVVRNLVWTFFFVMIIQVIFLNTTSIAGWSRGEVFVLAATCFLMSSFAAAMFQSLLEIPEQVRLGTLDFVITKPVDAQFWVSTRKFNFDQIGTLATGILMLAFGLNVSSVHPGIFDWLGYLVLCICSIGIFYSLNMALMTLGIWFVRVDNLWVLGETVMDVARYPIDIYGNRLRFVFLFVVPLGFLATMPAVQLVDGYNLGVMGLGILWASVSLFVCRKFWLFALTRYSSASS